jgi:hypothetical protein
VFYMAMECGGLSRPFSFEYTNLIVRAASVTDGCSCAFIFTLCYTVYCNFSLELCFILRQGIMGPYITLISASVACSV